MKKITILILSLFAGCIIMQAQDLQPRPIKPALLVIDVQNQFIPMVEQREKDIAFSSINSYIDYFRKMGFPVIRIYHTDKDWGPVPGSKEFAFDEDIKVLDSDPQVIKTYPDAFNKTNLDSLLKAMDCNTLFLTGLSSVGCVLATWFGAKDYDYKAFLLKYAIMSHSTQYTRQVEDMFEALGWDAVDVMVGAAEK